MATDIGTPERGFQPYVYTPLQNARKQIRLLKIMPEREMLGDVAHEITLETFDLDKAPSYTALSYEWGPLDDIQTILVNGKTHEIRKNLSDFFDSFKILCTMGKPDLPKPGTEMWELDAHECQKYLEAAVFVPDIYLWVDQICIDQANVEERNRQVAIMTEVFSRAYRVVAWLGPKDVMPGDSEAFRGLSRELRADKIDDSLWRFINLSYWARHWIAQELVLARQLIFVHGTLRLSLTILDEIRFGYDNFGIEADRMYDTSFFKVLNAVHRNKPEAVRWATTCNFSMFSLCQDPRDKIFGSQSLFDETARLRVDYRMGLHELYAQAALVYVHAKGLREEDTSSLSAWSYVHGMLQLAFGMGLTIEPFTAPGFKWVEYDVRDRDHAFKGFKWIKNNARDRDIRQMSDLCKLNNFSEKACTALAKDVARFVVEEGRSRHRLG